jgi:hypothetical protein
MNDIRLTPNLETCLRDEVIDGDHPGPVLRDFRVLVDFVGPQGVKVGGKYSLLPLEAIGELDQRLSRPLRLQLQRPQLRSHPYLQGLYLLLRASSLSRVEGSGARARLVLDPVQLAAWEGLNATEQYFNLLEAWLRVGRSEMVGERGLSRADLLLPCLQTWQFLPRQGKRFDLERPDHGYVGSIGRDFFLLALMDLFGLVEVELPARPVRPWTPAAVRHRPFGDALFTLLGSRFDYLWQDDGDEEAEPAVPHFGAWQPLFQPYFPQWRENLPSHSAEVREGTFIFRVSLWDAWRRIAVPADANLDTLVSLILRSVKFDDDHLYAFRYRNRQGARVTVCHPAMDEGPWADQVQIGTLPLDPGQTMELEYDFGDSWKFKIKLERIEPPGRRSKAPRILESHGKAPQQYRDWSEW